MANAIWQELTSAEAEADQLISAAQQEANAYLAQQRQELAAERESMLATPERRPRRTGQKGGGGGRAVAICAADRSGDQGSP